MEQVTEAEFARQHDVSREAVRKWKDEGYIMMTGDLVHVATSDGMLQAMRRGRFRTKRKPSTSRRQLPSTSRQVDARPSTAAADATHQHAEDFPAALNLSLIAANTSALYLALLDHLPPATARPLAERIVAKARADAVELLDEDGDFPPGFTSWADHPWFTRPPLTEAEWREIEDEWRLGGPQSSAL